jgi:glutathione peroxidase
MHENLYDFTISTASGKRYDLSELKGRPVLIVNTASKCGFTPQYAGLEELYKEYKDKGLEIIAFPCDQFAHQEPGSDEEIAQFCAVNYGVSFPVMSKINVNGKDAHPLFVWLKNQAPGKLGKAIKWNFTKFLVSKDGKSVKRFAPNVEPAELRADIEKEL